MNTSAGNDNGNGILPDICANCGKEGDEINNICNKCKQVKYCNAACKKKHRHKHKKQCEEHVRLAAERAAALHDIELFKEPPSQHGDCPICFVRIPNLNSGWKYQLCCGKHICSGCLHAPLYDNQGNEIDNKKCPFCRSLPPYTDEEIVKRTNKRIKVDDPEAIYNMGYDYYHGTDGCRQDYKKALELYHRAGELGHAMAYCNIGYAHQYGKGVEVDKKKTDHYYELAAIKGNEVARYNLGVNEDLAGNIDRALKHYIIAAGGGFNKSMKRIQQLYSEGNATKDDYTKALQSYQQYLGEIKSAQRDKAAADDEKCCYY